MEGRFSGSDYRPGVAPAHDIGPGLLLPNLIRGGLVGTAISIDVAAVPPRFKVHGKVSPASQKPDFPHRVPIRNWPDWAAHG
jgi:hypothetical protein